MEILIAAHNKREAKRMARQVAKVVRMVETVIPPAGNQNYFTLGTYRVTIGYPVFQLRNTKYTNFEAV